MPTPLNSCASSSTISRPSTATQPYDPEAFNKTLPPKRSLPFATPGAKKPRTAAKAKQPSVLSLWRMKHPSQPDPNKPTPSPIEQPPTPPISNTLTFPSSRMTQPYQSIQPGGSIEYPFVPSKSDKGLLTSADLTAYLSNPTDERTAIIQNWFSNLIQDDAFLQLCQDVEGAWGRIALGKRVD
ncbi:hypothetical protein PHISCL_02420 [Aspergillus sclerotialis]|uniref:Uncharacterized protein n=1 Tax=Aspergillus sclerotialis TaxID=2070753 RepID=A0A3A2ZRE0_9EURO|nr:hypothetical protein PHISCL_02420 [Aspergillus sclerotialis]